MSVPFGLFILPVLNVFNDFCIKLDSEIKCGQKIFLRNNHLKNEVRNIEGEIRTERDWTVEHLNKTSTKIEDKNDSDEDLFIYFLILYLC